MVLVNGCDGIGTGYSTFVPNYNPREIVDNLRRLMNGLEVMEMVCMRYWGSPCNYIPVYACLTEQYVVLWSE